jgi:hypothetical protein
MFETLGNQQENRREAKRLTGRLVDHAHGWFDISENNAIVRPSRQKPEG